MASTVFFTGFPGFLGRELLPRVLERAPERRAVCLIQARYRPQAEAAVRELEARHPSLNGRIDLVDGDITLPDLGLGATRADLAKEVVEVYHLAAVYDLAVGRDLAMKVNVEGTKNVLDFCEACPKLERLQYVSTCYVSGRHAGPFAEADLQVGQRFNNFYEETKHLAEVDVRARMGRLPATIYRPAIVVGDSSSGATQKYDGPYFAIRFLLKQPSPFAVMPLVGDPSTVRLNVVPRDFVVDAITTLSERDDNVGTTYQLADPAPLTVEELIDAMERETGKKLLKVPLPLGLAKGAIDHVPGVEPLFEFPSHIVDYFVHPTHYLTENAQAHLEESDVRCPRFDTYLDRLVDFVRSNPGVASKAMV
ncbi:MAG TPA: SDR family oxidoreductase [Polyangiaceae bacterium LLY-WYZ-15_(1-7)]|nr:acyl-CoA reductase [Myxococcales bacterium]MAT27610.1 acyl-CoA reductase [Sandaracinus sp.]HJL05298.1 SDR family oxidoreductase [Polyangiaceae bacterium LLY-WYZ-15_(1-7)]HJL07916.1 SDR family oxidoreductase [Polyangiaceae bacterium LLY-WYZ-15_(1-7)]HJL25792.1 SDR family oxidoreductase [Polyangiaceae bacterium LLY-WYZ-15_(1-7)]